MKIFSILKKKWGKTNFATYSVFGLFIKIRPISYFSELDNEYRVLQKLKGKDNIRFPKPLICIKLINYSIMITRTIGNCTAENIIHNDEHIVKKLAIYTKDIQSLKCDELSTAPYINIKSINKDRIFNVAKEQIMKKKLHPDFLLKCLDEIYQIIEKGLNYSPNKFVFVHGDFCPPNIIVEKGILSGLVDLGNAHMGDPLYDIAVMSWILRGVLGKNAEDEYLAYFNLTSKNHILIYYRLLYDLSLPDYKNWKWFKN